MSAVISPEKSPSFIVRFWNGDVALWKCYWLFGALVGTIIRVGLTPALSYLIGANISSLSAFDLDVINYGWSALTIGYSAVVLVAIWRSAEKYIDKFPAKAWKGKLGKAAVVLGWMMVVAGIVRTFDTSWQPTTADDRRAVQATIAGLNRDLPKMIDNITRLDRVDIKGLDLYNYHTVTVPISDRAKLDATIRGNLKKQCFNWQSYLKSGATYNYVYTDSAGSTVTVTITRADCGL